MDPNLLKTVMLDQHRGLFAKSPNVVRRLVDYSKHLNLDEITVITGVRRCGKSILLKQVANELEPSAVHYLNFEDQKLGNFNLDDFQKAYDFFLEEANPNQKIILMYDEIQNIENWEKWASTFSSQSNVKLFVTGSNSKLLSTELSSLLTGRHMQLHLKPFSFREVAQCYDVNTAETINFGSEEKTKLRIVMKDYLKFGAFPKSFLRKDSEILAQYYEDIITKDIAIRRRVRRPDALRALGSLLAAQNTRLFNKSKATEDIAVKDQVTVSKFCNYFVETFLFDELKLFSRSRRSQLRSLSKFYAVDPILALVNGYHHSQSDSWILENLVCNELIRRGYEVFYWHSNKGYEVDFIARAKDGELFAIQVSTNVENKDTLAREVRGLLSAREELKISKAILITLYERRSIVEAKLPIEIFPFYEWALSYPA